MAEGLTPEVKRAITIGSAVGASVIALKYVDNAYGVSNDLKMAATLLKLQSLGNSLIKNSNTIADVWESNFKRYPKKTCFLFEDKKYTFEEVDQGANRVANWAKSIGLKQGDVMALHMDNRPEYFMTWLGIAKVGGITSLLNYNVKGKGLQHSIKISNAKWLIVGTKVHEYITQIADWLKEQKIPVYYRGEPESVVSAYAQDLDSILAKQSTETPPRSLRAGLKPTDAVLLVYTSGTTGLPKAATIKHLRLFNMGTIFSLHLGIKQSDIIYCVLPLYHSAGGLCGTGMMIASGATMALRAKFSLSEFWNDCRKYNATVIQYIGELCRYLVGAPKQPNDKENSVRIAIGNGLRPEVWDEFQDRFNIPEIGEFYGSTEGNLALLNHCKDKRSRGSVGRIGPLLYGFAQMKVVKFDIEKEEIIRTKDGKVIECAHNEAGELIGEIIPTDPTRGFDGYHGNQEATSKKIARDVFKKGDMWFRSGDLLRRDSSGFWYFVDRIGDTFRWKGENVSTMEVSEVVSTFPGVSEANVYGVQVPGNQDGRACMAAMVFDDKLDWEKFAKHVKDNLPPYAIPLFIRKLPVLEVTSTFKHQKVELRKEGIDPTLIKDPLWWFDASKGQYAPFGVPQYESLAQRKSKL